jgi:hypothetical protein
MSNVVPEQIQIPPDAGGGGAPGAAAPGGDDASGNTDEHLAVALDALKAALAAHEGDDDMQNSLIAKMISDISKMVGEQDNAAMQMMGGDPKQMRSMAKATGAAGAGGGGGY